MCLKSSLSLIRTNMIWYPCCDYAPGVMVISAVVVIIRTVDAMISTVIAIISTLIATFRCRAYDYLYPYCDYQVMRVFDEAVKLCPPRRPFMPVHFVPKAPHAPAHLELPAKPPGTTHEPTQDEDDEGERERHASTRAHSGRTHARTHARTHTRRMRACVRRRGG